VAPATLSSSPRARVDHAPAAAPRSGEIASAKSTPQRGRRARELSPRGRGAAHRQAGV